MRQLISTDQDPTDIDPEVTLEVARKLIGGFVIAVAVPNLSGAQMLVREDGLIHNLSPNLNATVICRQPIVGDAILLTEGDKWK